MHVGINDAVDHQSRDVISKIFKLKEFIQLKVPSCKIIISILIKRGDNKKVSSVVDDVIQQLHQLNTETIINVSMKKKHELWKRELWKSGKPFCDLTQNDTNKLIKNQISSNSRITSIKDDNILHNFNDVNSNLQLSPAISNSERAGQKVQDSATLR